MVSGCGEAGTVLRQKLRCNVWMLTSKQLAWPLLQLLGLCLACVVPVVYEGIHGTQKGRLRAVCGRFLRQGIFTATLLNTVGCSAV